MSSKSTFVTALAWVFIVGAGFASFASIMQVIMASIMFSGDELQSTPEDAPDTARFIQQYFIFFVYGFCAVTIFTFVTSIALLKRKNWARLAFIGILAFGVLWQVGGLFLQFSMFTEFNDAQSEDGFEEFDRVFNIIRWFTVFISILVASLLLWCIKKLTSLPIKNEFTLHNLEASSGSGF